MRESKGRGAGWGGTYTVGEGRKRGQFERVRERVTRGGNGDSGDGVRAGMGVRKGRI